MAGLADDWEENRQTCVDVLCAFLRLPTEPALLPDARASGPSLADNREIRQTVIRVIAAHLRPGAAWQGLNFDFTGVVFDDGLFRFADAVFCGGRVSFDHAVFSGGEVDFSHAVFSGGQVSFDDAQFCGGTVSFEGTAFSAAAQVCSGMRSSPAARSAFKVPDFRRRSPLHRRQFLRRYGRLHGSCLLRWHGQLYVRQVPRRHGRLQRRQFHRGHGRLHRRHVLGARSTSPRRVTGHIRRSSAQTLLMASGYRTTTRRLPRQRVSASPNYPCADGRVLFPHSRSRFQGRTGSRRTRTPAQLAARARVNGSAQGSNVPYGPSQPRTLMPR